MDGLQKNGTIHSHCKTWKSLDIFFNITLDSVWLKEESHLHLGWLEAE